MPAFLPGDPLLPNGKVDYHELRRRKYWAHARPIDWQLLIFLLICDAIILTLGVALFGGIF